MAPRPIAGVGLMGIFEKKEEALNVIRHELIKMGMPEEDYDGSSLIAVPVDEDGNWADQWIDNDQCEYWMELSCTEVALNENLCGTDKRAFGT